MRASAETMPRAASAVMSFFTAVRTFAVLGAPYFAVSLSRFDTTSLSTKEVGILRPQRREIQGAITRCFYRKADGPAKEFRRRANVLSRGPRRPLLVRLGRMKANATPCIVGEAPIACAREQPFHPANRVGSAGA